MNGNHKEARFRAAFAPVMQRAAFVVQLPRAAQF